MDIEEQKDLAMKDLARRHPQSFPETVKKMDADRLDNLPEGVKETFIRRGFIKGEE